MDVDRFWQGRARCLLSVALEVKGIYFHHSCRFISEHHVLKLGVKQNRIRSDNRLGKLTLM
jgi:hypothetical protein